MLVLAPELYLPLRNLAAQFHASADGLAVAQRLLDLVDGDVAARTGARIAPSPRHAGVRLEGVSFAYPTRPAPVLDSVDLELRPGETVALVGPSGGGKSTVASLLLLLAEPDGGRVTAGDVDLADCVGGVVALEHRLGAAGADALPRHRRRQHPARRARRERPRGAGRRR